MSEMEADIGVNQGGHDSSDDEADESNRRRVESDEDSNLKTVVIGNLPEEIDLDGLMILLEEDPAVIKEMIFIPKIDSAVRKHALIDFPNTQAANEFKCKFDGKHCNSSSSLECVGSAFDDSMTTTWAGRLQTADGERRKELEALKVSVMAQGLGSPALTKSIEYYLRNSADGVRAEVRALEEKQKVAATVSSYSQALGKMKTRMEPKDAVKMLVRVFGNPVDPNWVLALAVDNISSKRDAIMCIPDQKGIQMTATNRLRRSITASEVYWALVILCAEDVPLGATETSVRNLFQPRLDSAIAARDALLLAIINEPELSDTDSCDCRVLRFITRLYNIVVQKKHVMFIGTKELYELNWHTDLEIMSLVVPGVDELNLTNGCPTGPSSYYHICDIKEFIASEWPKLLRLQDCRQDARATEADELAIALTVPKNVKTTEFYHYKVVDELSWPEGDEKSSRAMAFCAESELTAMLGKIMALANKSGIRSYFNELTGGNNLHGIPIIRFCNGQVQPIVGFRVKFAERIFNGTRIFQQNERSSWPSNFPFGLVMSKNYKFGNFVPGYDGRIRHLDVLPWIDEQKSGIRNPIFLSYFATRKISQAKTVREIFNDQDWAYNAFDRCLRPPDARESLKERKRREKEARKRYGRSPSPDGSPTRAYKRERGRSPEYSSSGRQGSGQGSGQGGGFHSSSSGRGGGFHSSFGGRGDGYHSSSGGRGGGYHSSSGGQGGKR